MSSQSLIVLGTDLVSGIHTDVLLEGDPPAFWVTWIDWDSDFRRELRIGDMIVGVNDVSLEPILKPQQTDKGVGQYGEVRYWAEIGAVAGQEIILSILRDGQPMSVCGKLGASLSYYDREGKSALAPGGPVRLVHDTFVTAWASWYEKLQWKMSLLFTRAWSQQMSTRMEFAELLDHQPRIDYLLAAYPGPFAQATHDDWSSTVELVRGKLADPPVDLEYRSISAQRIAIAKVEAAKAWQAVLDETAKERIPAIPAASPFVRAGTVGKLVELPVITNDNILNDLGKTFAAVGAVSDGYWFIPLDRPEIQQFYEVLFRYQGQVNPQLVERYRYLVRVLDDAWMLTVNGRAVTGIAVQPIAALAGEDEMFVDLRQSPSQFAGELALSIFAKEPRDDTSAICVVNALIQAVKTGDEATWRSLFAPWRAYVASSGRTIIDMNYAKDPRMFATEWEHSRRNIMLNVYDVRISHVEKIRHIISYDKSNGIPDIEEIIVWVDHYGLFDGEHRVFQDISVNRRWPLQRIDGGLWKIVKIQTL